MRKILLSLILLCFFTAPSSANPIETNFLNELTFDSSGWKLELHCNVPANISLDGYYLISNSDTAYFVSGISISDDEYVKITNASLTSVFNINQKEDTIRFYSPEGYMMDYMTYGENTRNTAPLLNQSLCVYQNDEFYLDLSPTIGSPNELSPIL